MTKKVSNPNRMPEKTELVLFKDSEINLEVPVIPEGHRVRPSYRIVALLTSL